METTGILFQSIFLALMALMVIILLVMVILERVRTQGNYFVSYVTQKAHQPALFQNCVIDTHPVEWQLMQNENSNGMRYRVISWNTISNKESQLFEEGKHPK